jgi:hypothetical protein
MRMINATPARLSTNTLKALRRLRYRGWALSPSAEPSGHAARSLGAIALVLAVSGCLPVTSTSPVGTTKGLGADRRLAGMWHGSTGNAAPGWFAFVPDDHGGMTAIVTSFPSGNESSGFYGTYAVRTASLGKAAYMNAREVMESGKPATGPLAENSMLLLYRFDGERTLTLYLVDEDAAKQAVGTGKIAGVVQGGQFGDVTLTAKPADLDRFFASDAALKLFTKPFIVLSRAK